MNEKKEHSRHRDSSMYKCLLADLRKPQRLELK